MARQHNVLWPDRVIHPPYGSARIDWAHPLARGLVAWFAPHVDLVSGLRLTPGGGAGLVGFGGRPELAVRSETANARFAAVAPPQMKVQPPMTFACRVRVLAEPDDAATFAGISAKNVHETPYVAFCLAQYPTGDLLGIAYSSSGGTYQTARTSAYDFDTLSFPWVAHLLATIPYNATPTLMVNGAETPFTGGGVSVTGLTYSATSEVHVGEYSSTLDRVPHAEVTDFQIWNRALSADEAKALYREPYALLRAVAPVAFFDLGAVPEGGGGPTEGAGSSSGVATVTGVAGAVPATQTIVTIAMADGARTGGELAFTVEATDASGENEVYTGAVRFAAQRKGAAVTGTVEDIGTGAITKSHAGADPTVTAVVDVSSGTSVALRLTVDSALTPTTLKAHWHLTMLKGHGEIS